MQQVIRQCDRAIYMEKGSVVADGDPEEVVESYKSTWTAEEVLGALS